MNVNIAMKTTASKSEVDAVIAAVTNAQYLSAIQVITGTIEENRLSAIEAMPGVEAVEPDRQVFAL